MQKVNLKTNGMYRFSHIDTDITYRMEAIPYPPEPSFDFLIEEDGKLIKLLEIWVGYFDALFLFAYRQDLINNDFGDVWCDISWVGIAYGDWELSKEDVLDFISILTEIKFYELDDKEKETIFMPEIQELEELRNYLLDFFKNKHKNSKVYLHKF